jgi:DNA-binding transcriptional LysR family regulator
MSSDRSGPPVAALPAAAAPVSRRRASSPRDDRGRIELRHLRYFVAVAEERNVSRAAIRLGVSQPPLSYQIRQLETWLQVALFRRTPRGVDLTAAGEEFLEHARMLLTRLDRAVDAARYIERGTGGTLQLGCVYSVQRLFGPAITSAVEAAFPSLRLNFKPMTMAEQAEALLAETIDVGVVTDAIASDLIRTRVLIESPMVAALPADHAFAAKRSVTLRDIASETGLPPGAAPARSFRTQASDIFRRRGLVAPGLHEVADIVLLMELVEAGMGIALVPDCLDRCNYPKAVFRPVADGPPPPYVLFIAWRTDSLTPLRSAFIDHVTRLDWRSLIQAAPYGSTAAEA